MPLLLTQDPPPSLNGFETQTSHSPELGSRGLGVSPYLFPHPLDPETPLFSGPHTDSLREESDTRNSVFV